jgi:branched-chain amino acid transport system ATP-binding protein
MDNHQHLLHVRALEKRFGGVMALHDYSLTVGEGDFVGIIGPNGAGKTTIFNLLSGVISPSAGNIFLRGRDVTRLRADQRARLGVARTFQNIRLFPDLTVLDNIRAALDMHHGRGLLSSVLPLPGRWQAEEAIMDSAMEQLRRLDLGSVSVAKAGSLPYGLQRRVEIARALATQPRLLLLDEPAAGMNRNETDELIKVIQEIHAGGRLAILLVEHDMGVVMKLCPHIQVLHQGGLLMEGAAETVRTDQRVVEAYLGVARGSKDA